MKDSVELAICKSPEGHEWVNALEHTPKSGVMPVHCPRCNEIGFHFQVEEKVND